MHIEQGKKKKKRKKERGKREERERWYTKKNFQGDSKSF